MLEAQPDAAPANRCKQSRGAPAPPLPDPSSQKRQAAALLLFNEADELSYSEVSQRLNLPDEDVGRLLHRWAGMGGGEGLAVWVGLCGCVGLRMGLRMGLRTYLGTFVAVGVHVHCCVRRAAAPLPAKPTPPPPPHPTHARPCSSLSCAKYKILRKEPEGKTLSKSDRFAFNENFTDRWGPRRARLLPAGSSLCCAPSPTSAGPRPAVCAAPHFAPLPRGAPPPLPTNPPTPPSLHPPSTPPPG